MAPKENIFGKRQLNVESIDSGAEIVGSDVNVKGASSAPYKMKIRWGFLAYAICLHVLAGIYLVAQEKRPFSFFVSFVIYSLIIPFGTNVGSHRYFTHRSFKANKKLRFLLIVLQTMAGQQAIFRWVRDHRLHHKCVDTDADPYSPARGIFFSHIGWVFVYKHPDVIKQGNTIDMSDMENDPVLMFQMKHFIILRTIGSFIIPTLIVYSMSQESLFSALTLCVLNYIICIHSTFLINSYGHHFGTRPYDKNISATDSYLHSFITKGEGWHNFHHTFPWDYKSSEDINYFWNINTGFIDFFAWLGWATDLKTAPAHIVKSRALRTGDGSRRYSTEMIKNVEIRATDCILDERLS